MTALLRQPVLAAQAAHPAKFARVAGDERHAKAQGMRRDQRVERPDGRAGALELSAQRVIVRADEVIE